MELSNKISASTIVKIAPLILLALFIPYLILCFYAHPIADDYTYNSASLFWRSQLEMYSFWNGRYVANFLVMCNPILFNSLFGYRFAATILLLLMPLSIYFLLSSVTEKALSSFQKIILAIVSTLLILSLMPSLAEGIYWYTGSVTYILGCIVALFYVGAIVAYYKKNFVINRVVHFSCCIILLFIAFGFNEVQALLLVVGHLFVWLNIKRDKKIRPLLIVLLIFCAVFAATIFFSPGNYFRTSYFSNNHRLFYSLFMSLQYMVRFFFAWISYSPLWIASILFAPISFKLTTHLTLFRELGRVKPFVFFFLLWGILFISIFLPCWSTGILGQYRTVNTACFFFIPS